MNIRRPEKIVLLGFLSHFPVAGVAWQTVHYLIGLQRLGFDVYYVEAHGCTPSKLMRSDDDDGALRAATYISEIMTRFGLGDRWAYHAPYPSPRFFGMTESALRDVYASAALLINLHGSHLPTADLTATNRLVYLGTDPVDVEIDLFDQKQESIDYLAPHCAFFSYGENLRKPDCRVPVPRQFDFKPTRQPVVLNFWKDAGGGAASTFTTIGNWKQLGRPVRFQGEVYRWSKHLEFQKVIDLPRRVAQPFELALASYGEADERLLQNKGWRVRPAIEFTLDLDAYREYIGQSRGEFTVAKDQNVRLRSGWFSDRAATYLAAGRPVITQETGFSNLMPTGTGLFAFSTLDEAVAAVEAVNADYEKHRRGAFDVAREFFDHEVVLKRLLDDVGVSFSRPSILADRKREVLPASMRVAPVSRWPTRLAEETIKIALDLPTPSATAKPSGNGASIVIVTHQGLAYTKLCLTALLGNGWDARDELIVVDNASTDGTVGFLRELSQMNPFVKLILNETNRGFAAANTQGIAVAINPYLILLNSDTLVLPGWRDRLLQRLSDASVGLVGPVTNRTCNEAQIDAPYVTYGELEHFARERTIQFDGVSSEIPMLAMYCVALRKEVYEQVGPLDERFEIGMFEDDDYAMRMRVAEYRILCTEDVFVHHFGQASLGELCTNGKYDEIFETNRRRFEMKWGMAWRPHGRRVTPEYRELRERIRQSAADLLPHGARVMVVSKGDEELLNLGGACGLHFPQDGSGDYANVYPADSTEAIAQLESLRSRGAEFLLIPKPAFWWLDFYSDFKVHLESRYRPVMHDDETCVIFDVGGRHG
ncbi:glycosyltransferase [bacterium]|nr:glycosyltransferase [bacterium]